MTRPMVAAGVLVVLAGLSAGCAPIQKDAGFHDVQTAIRERSGFLAYWDQQPREEGPAAERTRVLLQDELTDRSAVEIALLNNRRLQATFEELGVARADLMEARTIRNPFLGGELRFPGSPVEPFEIFLVQDLLDLMRLHKRSRLAGAAFEAAKLRVSDEVLRLVAEVRSSFFTLQGAEQVKSMRATIVESARVSAELAIRQHDSGNITDLDLETEQALFEQTKLDLARSESEALVERERLNALLGLWGPDTDWRAAAALPDLPPVEPDLQKLEAIAVMQRLDLSAARQEIEVAARALPLSRSGAIGDITVGVHHERDASGASTTGPSVEVPIPIFNRGRAARERAAAILRQAQQRYAALAVEVRAEVRSARNRLVGARSRVEYFRDVILPRRARIVEQTQLGYNGMLIGVFQLLQAKQSEVEARRESIEALRDYWTAQAEMDRAAGGRAQPSAAGADPASLPSGVARTDEQGQFATSENGGGK